MSPMGEYEALETLEMRAARDGRARLYVKATLDRSSPLPMGRPMRSSWTRRGEC